MTKALRAQANFAEYVPMILILLFFAEETSISIYLLHLCGGLLLIGRISHAYSLLVAEQWDGKKIQGTLRFRQVGMVMTFSSMLILASAILINIML